MHADVLLAIVVACVYAVASVAAAELALFSDTLFPARTVHLHWSGGQPPYDLVAVVETETGDATPIVGNSTATSANWLVNQLAGVYIQFELTDAAGTTVFLERRVGGKGSSAGMICGLVLGVVLGVLALGALYWHQRKRNARARQRDVEHAPQTETNGTRNAGRTAPVSALPLNPKNHPPPQGL